MTDYFTISVSNFQTLVNVCDLQKDASDGSVEFEFKSFANTVF